MNERDFHVFPTSIYYITHTHTHIHTHTHTHTHTHRVSTRKQIQNKKLEAVIDAQASCFVITVDDDRDNPIVMQLPSGCDYHLCIMGYSGTTITFLDDI